MKTDDPLNVQSRLSLSGVAVVRPAKRVTVFCSSLEASDVLRIALQGVSGNYWSTPCSRSAHLE